MAEHPQCRALALPGATLSTRGHVRHHPRGVNRVTRETPTFATVTLLYLCTKAFATSGLLMMGRSSFFDGWLRALDVALASFQATRGCVAHGSVKSSARLLCPPGRMSEFLGFDTPNVHDTVTVLSQDCGTTALGSMHALGNRCAPATKCARQSRASTTPPTEMVLTRQSADVSKLMYQR